MADNLSITKVLDPRLRTDIDNEYIAVIGADNWVKYKFGASALSNTQMAFNNIKPAGERFMINTRWYIEYTARFILTADNSGTTKLLVKGKFGFRPWPLQNCDQHSAASQQQGLQHKRAVLASCSQPIHLL